MPLFPLNTVLFPGMLLPLHIFETRYKQMINKCLEEDRLFGVVLIKQGSESLGPLAEPYQIGCTARIIEMQTLEEGRMNITAIGEDRFRIKSLSYELPYLVGEVESHPFVYTAEEQEQVQAVMQQLIPKIMQYIHLLNQIETIDLDQDDLPDDPAALGHFAAALLQMPPVKKQALLQTENQVKLLKSINQEYLREIAFLRAIIEGGKDQPQVSFSQN
jgi:Lon protease-like protein